MTKLAELTEQLAGTTVHLVPHFHFDPVWWNTQSASVSELRRSDWSTSPRMRFQASAFEVLDAHLERARADPDFRFCVAEIDYLEPYWQRRPERRAELMALLADDRLEVVGGTYNEPSTNLIGREATERSFAQGLAFQRGVLGAAVSTAWQLDVFGHDPSFPSVAAAAGLDAAVFARGPYGPWGPMIGAAFASPGDPVGVQFPTEFEWIAPDGRSVLGVYLAAHYSTGYGIDACQTWEEAAAFVLELAVKLRPIAATGHVLILVGTDVAPPARWVTELARRFVAGPGPVLRCSLPHHFLDAVRHELAASGGVLSPQTRDLNPVYTGKDVSYIDTKQAQQSIEDTLAGLDPDDVDVAEAWRLVVYLSHHDALTGTESDQVYLELLASWRRAHNLAARARRRLLAAAASEPTPDHRVRVVVHNSTGRARTDVVRIRLTPGDLAAVAGVATADPGTAVAGIAVIGSDGTPLPAVAEALLAAEDGTLLGAELSVVVEMPAAPTVHLEIVSADATDVWAAVDATSIANEHHRVSVDPARGGCIDSWVADGTPVVSVGQVAAELVLVAEHATHPDHGEGPWHLLPREVVDRTSTQPADVAAAVSPAGSRITSTTTIGGARAEVELTLWQGVDRLDVVITVDSFDGSDHLLRLCWPVAVDGARPVVSTAAGAIGRGFALLHADAAEQPWTLETPARRWFALSSTCTVSISGRDDGTEWRQAISIAEIVVATDDAEELRRARRLAIALAQAGVTATTTIASGARYGRLGLDSNAPDVRIVLADSPDSAALSAAGAPMLTSGRHWIAAERELAAVWVPGLDVTAPGALPMLAVVGDSPPGLDAELVELEHLLATTQRITAHVAAPAGADAGDSGTGHAAPGRFDDRTVALVHRGTPSCAVEPDGTLVTTLQRGCSAWPAGQWIDPPRRTAPDGSAFALQHWTHRYEFAAIARPGDWRTADVEAVADDVHRPLVVTTVGEAASALDNEYSAGTATFARHWVQGVGPAAPTPFTVHLHPPALGDRWRVTVAAAAAARGELVLQMPPGWRGHLDDDRFDLLPGEWMETMATVSAPTPTPAGHHVIGVFAHAAGHVCHDQHVLALAVATPALELPESLAPITLVPGGSATVTITIGNHTDAELTGHLDVLSPWGTWDLLAPARRPLLLPAGRSTSVELSFAAGPDALAGRWWWGCRVVAGPLVGYTPTASLAVVAGLG